MSRSSGNRSRGIDSRWIEDDAPRWCSGYEQRLAVEAIRLTGASRLAGRSRCKVCDREKSRAYYERVRRARCRAHKARGLM